MLHSKMLIINEVQETIQTNKNGEFAGHMQIRLSWIPEAPSCSLVVEHITVVGRSFSQLFEVDPKHCVVKWGSPVKILPRGTRSPVFSVFLGTFGIQDNLTVTKKQRNFSSSTFQRCIP